MNTKFSEAKEVCYYPKSIYFPPDSVCVYSRFVDVLIHGFFLLF